MSKSKLEPGFWIGLVIVTLIMLFCAPRCHATEAVIDTVVCYPECIQKFIEVPQQNGKTRIFALYDEPRGNIHELISVPKTVYEYIQLCTSNKIKPQLGIRLRNGQITSIIKLKKIYYVRKK